MENRSETEKNKGCALEAAYQYSLDGTAFSEMFGNPETMTREQAVVYLEMMKESFQSEAEKNSGVFNTPSLEFLARPAEILMNVNKLFEKALDIGIEALSEKKGD